MALKAFFLSLKLLFHRIGILLGGNVLWILISLPLVTLPAATGALFYLVHRVILEERKLNAEPAQIRDFWVGLRTYWWRSTILGFLDLAALLVMLVALQFYLLGPQDVPRFLAGPVLIFLLVWLAMQLYLFPLLIALPEESIWAIIRKAFLQVIGYPLDSLLMLIWLLILAGASIVLAGPVLLILFSALALNQTMMLRIIRINRGEIPESSAR